MADGWPHVGGIVLYSPEGLLRTGLLAARLLIELGEQPSLVLQRIRLARYGAVETWQQEDCVLKINVGKNFPPSIILVRSIFHLFPFCRGNIDNEPLLRGHDR